MNRRILVLFLLSVGVVPVAGRADPVEEVHGLLDLIEQAWDWQDLEALDRDCLDGDMLTIRSVQDGLEEGAWVFDRQADLDRIAGIWKRVKLKCHVVGREISVQGDIAWMRLTVAYRGPDRLYRTGRLLALALRRNGKWKWSFSMPLFVRNVWVVADVSPGSQAERLGIKAGDVIGPCGTGAVCDDDALARWAEAGNENETQKTMPLVVIRGNEYLRFEVPPGDLGVRLEDRLLPADGAVLVEAHEDHPIRQRLRERLDAVKANNLESALDHHLCPDGYFSLEPVESGPPRVTTRSNLRQRWAEEVPVLRETFDISTFKLEHIRLIVDGDVALVSSRVRGVRRGQGEKRVDAPMRLEVFVRQHDHWWLAAILPKTTQIGLDVGSTTYFSAEETARRKRLRTGRMVGLGVSIDAQSDGILIKRVLPDSGATKAGLKDGEIITKIDGRATPGMTNDSVVRLLRGPEGTTVRLKVRSQRGRTRTVTVTRGSFVISGVDQRMLSDDIGLLRVTAFNQETVSHARRAIEKLSAQGAVGLVLDLRGISSGPEKEMRKFADLFIGPGQVLWFRRPLKGRPKPVRAETEASVQMPLVVLVDSKTEGGELVAAAIKRHKRGKLIGQKTSGKTTAKILTKHEDGSSEVEVQSEYYINRRTPITGRGIQPHVRMPPDATPQDVLDRAIELLKRELSGE